MNASPFLVNNGGWLMIEEFILCRAQKKLSAVTAWENSKKASVEAELKKIEVTYNSLIKCQI